MEPVEAWLEEMRARVRRPGWPVVTLSYAQSLDGCLALETGQPFSLSGQETQILTHRLRAAHDAILVGIGTVLADDPRLDVRYAAGQNPIPVVLDAHLRIPDGCRLLQRSENLPWVAASRQASLDRKQGLEQRGVVVLELGTNANGELDLPELLAVLWERGVRSLMVEGGARVLTSFFKERLGDLAVVTIAPMFLGGLSVTAASLAADGKLPVLQEFVCETYGKDWVVRGLLGEKEI